MSLHTIATPHLLRLEQDTLWLGEINYRPLQELGGVNPPCPGSINVHSQVPSTLCIWF